MMKNPFALLVRRATLLGAVILCWAGPVLSGPALIDFGFESLYNDNLSLTPQAAGESLSGGSSTLSAAIQKSHVLSEDFAFITRLGADYHVQHIDESADYASANIVLAGNYSPFDSYSAPRFKASVQARAKDYQNDYENDEVYRAKLSMQGWVTQTLSAQIGVARRWGEDEWAPVDTLNTQSWDTEQTEYFVSMDVRTGAGTLYSKLSRSDGDHIWAVPVDGGFNGRFGTDIETLGLDLGFNYPLTDHAVLDVLARHYSVRRNDNKMYDRTSLSIAYLQRLSL